MHRPFEAVTLVLVTSLAATCDSPTEGPPGNGIHDVRAHPTEAVLEAGTRLSIQSLSVATQSSLDGQPVAVLWRSSDTAVVQVAHPSVDSLEFVASTELIGSRAGEAVVTLHWGHPDQNGVWPEPDAAVPVTVTEPTRQAIPASAGCREHHQIPALGTSSVTQLR